MTAFDPAPATPLVLAGDARSRGRGQASDPAADAARVRAATVGRVETARAAGIVDAQALAYLAQQKAFHLEHDPDGMAELSGIAEGFDLAEDDLIVVEGVQNLRPGVQVKVERTQATATADAAAPAAKL